MTVEPTAIPAVLLLTPPRHGDERGTLTEVYREDRYAEVGVPAVFVQDNHAWSAQKGVVRGLHFQKPPHAQAKLVRVSHGAILDVAVDLREGSPTYGRHVAAELSRENGRQMYVPEGFAHGYCTLEPDTVVEYKLSGRYAPESEGGVMWNDPALGIEWPVSPGEVILSAKDRRLPTLAELGPVFGSDGTSAAGHGGETDGASGADGGRGSGGSREGRHG